MSYDEAIIPLLTRLKRDSLQISNKPANNTTTTNGHMRLWDSQQYGNQWIFDIIGVSKKKTMGIYVCIRPLDGQNTADNGHIRLLDSQL